jgi:hypothetical protein
MFVVAEGLSVLLHILRPLLLLLSGISKLVFQ